MRGPKALISQDSSETDRKEGIKYCWVTPSSGNTLGIKLSCPISPGKPSFWPSQLPSTPIPLKIFRWKNEAIPFACFFGTGWTGLSKWVHSPSLHNSGHRRLGETPRYSCSCRDSAQKQHTEGLVSRNGIIHIYIYMSIYIFCCGLWGSEVDTKLEFRRHPICLSKQKPTT